eukprot:6197530-Pleurochrysis_carterae.AAC.1
MVRMRQEREAADMANNQSVPSLPTDLSPRALKREQLLRVAAEDDDSEDASDTLAEQADGL